RAPGTRSVDLALAAVPVLLAQLALEHLARAGNRQAPGDLHAPRRLVPGDRALAVLAQLGFGQRLPGLQDHYRVPPLAPLGIGPADDGARGHGRMPGHGV